MISATRLLAVLTATTAGASVTRGLVFDIDANQLLAVANAPFVAFDCVLGGNLLVRNDNGRSQEGPRATLIRISSSGRIEFAPPPKGASRLDFPQTIIPIDDGVYRLLPQGSLSPLVFQHWDVQRGDLRSLELPTSSLPARSTLVPIDGHQIIAAGGEVSDNVQNLTGARDVVRFDLDTGELKHLPQLAKPRENPFVVQLADGRIMTGGGREGGRRVLWGAVAACVGAGLAMLIALAGLVLLVIKVPPRLGTVALALVAAAVSLALLALVVFSQIRVNG
jgi:hypothetical protein